MRHTQSGQSIIELLVALALSLLILPVLFSLFFASREGRAQQQERVAAASLTQESVEALRSIREIGWDSFAQYQNGVLYHVARNGNAWSLEVGSESANDFTRSILLSAVSRDASGAIVESGGTVDPSTRKAVITVSWATPLPSTVSTSILLTRHENILVVETTEADFSAGTLTHAVIRNTAGGEVVLGSTGGRGDWCNPGLSIAALDLPKSGVANAISAVPFTVATGTGDNSSGVSFAKAIISDVNPPVSSVSGTFDGYKTNGLFTDSNYAYLATDTNSKEVTIVDLSSVNGLGKYAEAGYYNAPGNGSARSVAVSGNIGFATVGNTLYTFDLSSKSGSRPQLGSRSLYGTGTKVVVNGSYAFVSISGAVQELQIIEFSANGQTLTTRGWADVNGQAAIDVSINNTGTRAYLATGADGSRPEFFIIDTSSKTGARPNISTYDASGMNPKAVSVVTASRVILVGTGGEEYQVIDISNEAFPVRCGGMQIDSGVNGVASVVEPDYDAYSYIITGDASSELKIIEGGPGSEGGNFFLSGSYESKIYDASQIATGSATVLFNRVTSNIISIAELTDLTVQFASSDPGVAGCQDATYTYVGPDGTGGTYFSATDSALINGSLPLSNDGSGYENPARCFRYRVNLSSTDTSFTPQLLDTTIAFSP